MKFTDTLFSFPAILYDGIEMIKREQNELDKESFLTHDAGVMPYAVGIVKIPFTEIQSIQEYWTKGTPIQEVIDNGPNCTMIMTETLDNYLCSWTLKKLEIKLNEFEEKLNKLILEEEYNK